MAWLSKAVEKMGPLAGTIFKVVDSEQLVKQKKVMVWVPRPIKFDTRALFKRLERDNPGLKTTFWRSYDRVTSPSGTRFDIGVDEASVGTIAGPGFRSLICLHKAIFSFLGKPGAEAETKVPKYNGNPLHTGKPPAQQDHLRESSQKEPWCYKSRIRGLNLRGGQIISCASADRPRACIYVNGVDAMPLPQLSTMDLAAAVLSFQEWNMIRRIVICSSYLPYDAPDPPPNRELEIW
ncbi:hypothetical protein J437_LFUL015938 [Ladona fulva]|uniref:DUF4780 domain-containing protein n=1 Tax=Ladona fulva TaxID=123851 RepID=A0A8K0KJB2_LADFU|nr:hypothetical protein J437_LFUL015938 [Ladona fulva]